MYDPSGDQTQYLRVKYEGGVAATFGNDVTAICTGKVGADGVLHATELVTKCPSKYENSSNALGVAQLAEYGDSVLDKPVKVTGTVKAVSYTHLLRPLRAHRGHVGLLPLQERSRPLRLREGLSLIHI